MTRVTPTKRQNTQHLVDYEKQLLYENKKIRVCHATAYGFLRLWYKYKLRSILIMSYFTFRMINMFLSNSGTPIFCESKSGKTRDISDLKFIPHT